MWDELSKGNYAEVLRLAQDARRCLERGFNLRWYVYAVGGEALANSWFGRWQCAIEVAQENIEMAK